MIKKGFRKVENPNLTLTVSENQSDFGYTKKLWDCDNVPILI